MEDFLAPDASALSWPGRLVRCYYRALETLLERVLLDYILVESFRRFQAEGKPYPFVRRTELRPGGAEEVGEHREHNACLVLLLEHELLPELQTNIRARRPQEVVQKNLRRYLGSAVRPDRVALLRDLAARVNLQALKPLLQLDYGLLIQRRIVGKRGYLHFAVSHFHVKVDEVQDRVVESLGLRLRYLARHLYEQGEEYAALLEEKFYELYGMKSTAAGRRTAALVAHNLLLRSPGLHTVYVGSTEARSLIKIEKDDRVTRWVLVELDAPFLEQVAKTHGLTVATVRERYLVGGAEPQVGVLAVHYRPTAAGRPPADRKLRRQIRAAERWCTIAAQELVPLVDELDAAPLAVSWIYASERA